MSAAMMDAVPARLPAQRVAALGARLGTELDAQGSAVIPQLLGVSECRSLAALYSQDRLFRSRIVMASHGFGRGEYRYFTYPPDADRACRVSRALPRRIADTPDAIAASI